MSVSKAVVPSELIQFLQFCSPPLRPNFPFCILKKFISPFPWPLLFMLLGVHRKHVRQTWCCIPKRPGPNIDDLSVGFHTFAIPSKPRELCAVGAGVHAP
ncbi:unnamed protein product [Chondrus crispus]|uniref:Uncharacterized protein n=1 Tax=Chondrus crispus TaxID=2769 RepID=S0F3V8_CHOCR|nr:unnamed protein product [Chondrus crispus]CDF77508.1 unnamed protein product [Chondrus crispus]|eukprot:XP_005712547.1 unnamed protein product [Chondrus crispus]